MKPIIALLALALLSVEGQALGMCGKRADFLAALKGKYNENPRAIAIAGEINLVEVFASKAGTWTILVTAPDGKSCMIAAGKDWQELPLQIEETDL